MIHRFNSVCFRCISSYHINLNFITISQVSKWIVKLILTGKTASIRTKIAEKFIDIADELFKLNSFNSVMSILSAFESSSAHRVRSVWESKLGGISSGHQEKLTRLQTTLKIVNNMTTYRDLFTSLPPPKLPFLGMYLGDLTFIDDGNPNFVGADEEKGIINFKKRTKFAAIISVIQRLQKEAYKFVKIDEIFDVLVKVSGFDGDHDKVAYDVSKFIENKSGELSHDDISEIDIQTVRRIVENPYEIPTRLTISKRSATIIQPSAFQLGASP